MREERKNPAWTFWATAALVTVLAYPLSFGPAVWYMARHDSHPGTAGWFTAVYWPIGWLSAEEYRLVRPAVYWYALLGSPKSAEIFLPDGPSGETGMSIEAE
jgi:hypothetical protein